jgi:hypothetical protein
LFQNESQNIDSLETKCGGSLASVTVALRVKTDVEKDKALKGFQRTLLPAFSMPISLISLMRASYPQKPISKTPNPAFFLGH